MKLLLVAVSSMIVLALAERRGNLKDNPKNDYMTPKEIEVMQSQLATEKQNELNLVLAFDESLITRFENSEDYSRDKAQCVKKRFRDAEEKVAATITSKRGQLEQELKSGHPIKKSDILAKIAHVRKQLQAYISHWEFNFMASAFEECGAKFPY